MPNQQDKARHLAGLEAALAAELTSTRTMTIAVASVASPRDLEPAVGAWIADWTEYHSDRADSVVIKHALKVAVDQVNARRVTDAVWHHHHSEWSEIETGTAPAKAAADAGLHVVVPGNVPRTLPVEISVNGNPRTVPAVCARALLDVALGQDPVRFRIETQGKLIEHVPEVVPHFVRDSDLKIVSKRIAWRPTAALRTAVRIDPGTLAGTEADTGS